MKRLPLFLLFIYFVLSLFLAINPYSRSVWFVENLPIWIILVKIYAIHFKWHKFSNLAFVMMYFLIYLHTIGAHFTFERVPFGFVTELFNFERNHFDRVSHFTVGFYAFPIAEILMIKKYINSKFLIITFAIFSICAVASFYEIFEWWYALKADPRSGLAVLGSQGDIWDAQKDMLADILGSFLASIIFIFRKR